MNLQEREQLTGFLQQLAQTQAGQKDAEAEMLIRDACSRQPDAAYLLVQRALLLEHAVQAAQTKIGQLQSALEQTRPAGVGGGGAFLDPNAWGQTVRPGSVAAPVPPPLQPAPQAAPAPAPAASSWGSGLLGSVATTAAGVVAGSFLFQGIEHLMGHHGSGWGGNAAGAMPLSGTTENVVVNNYYDNGSSGSAAGALDTLAVNDDVLDDIDAGDII